MEITPREKIYDEFWCFAFKRQDVFYNKINGKFPLTDDPILAEYKFCNCYRVLDRVSQYLIKNVIYTGNFSAEDTIFRIVLFKIFNLPSTWEYLEKNIKEINIKTFNYNIYNKLLTELNKNKPIYNDAYITCANKVFGFNKKHENHLKLLEKMFLEDNLSKKIINCKNMKEAFNLLINYPLIGKFMAYQLVTDINYSNEVNWSECEFTVAGPGAERGINKCFISFNNYEEIIEYCYKNQKKEFERLNLDFKYLNNRLLQYIDIQNLFCEFDKYCREAHPELKSNRVKIKKKYTPKNTNIEYMLPPKWNARI